MYRPGDTIAYRAWGGELRIVKVEERERNINGEGKPGFSGRDERGHDVWGFDSQICFAPGMLPVTP